MSKVTGFVMVRNDENDSDNPEKIEPPIPGFESFEGHLEQCFLNCIARKNFVQQGYNLSANYNNFASNKILKSQKPENIDTKDIRNKCIINALKKVLKKAREEGLGDYVYTSFKDAGMNYIKNTGKAAQSWGMFSRKSKNKGGKKTRKTRK